MEKLFVADFGPEHINERKRTSGRIANDFSNETTNDSESISAVRYRVAEYGTRNTIGDPSPSAVEHEIHLPKETDAGGSLTGTYTIDQAINFIGFGSFQIKLSLLTGLAWMADAMEMMILSILGPELHCLWGLTSWQQALVTTVVFCGMVCSSTLWGHACDRYGRKSALITCSMVTFYFGFLSSFAPDFYWMLVLRGAVGWGIGGAPQSVTLYSEFLPANVRAKCLIYIELFWAIGAVFEVLLALFIMPTLGWRWLLAFSSMPLMLFGVLCLWMPESARYYLSKGQHSKALAVLQRIAKANGKTLPSGQLALDSAGSASKTINGAPAPVVKASLLNKELRTTTLLLWWIWLSNAFSYYGIVLMSTELIQIGDTCQVPSFTHDLEPPCSLDCRRLSEHDYWDLLWSTFSEFPALVITALIVDCLGRKRTMAAEFSIFSISTFLLMLCTGRQVMVSLLFTARCFISGAFQAAYVYTPEVYPTSIRAVGLGTCSAMARIGAILTPFVAQVVIKYSVYSAVITYGAVCVLGAVASLLLPIETAGRSMDGALLRH